MRKSKNNWYNGNLNTMTWFRQFGQFISPFRVYLVLCKNLNLYLPILKVLGKFVLLQIAKRWTNNLAIWSHWQEPILYNIVLLHP